ncbi:Flp pilus assembly complex ATPase component TadA [Burkholderia dolosa]|uniref:Flp pilus assembly complex ATPase component TadA n=1 Tax=Burkholderia dolosa TaxID=152500 RepID=A0A892I828_9BURK|nr:MULTISPECIES: ATPase, T2SS/T4P/T4SS family [Burkholderia]AKE06827.1 type II secretion system protein E [Burkholderia cepacia]AJY13556.1 type II/IV secretion system family protein [Burkholderia dolosa AU0158]AYZ99034.1 GspE family protein [Burkholderia dolosa]ETP66487.1 type II secretion system protein E [Burkholderia dolosa PC543]MBR8417561.1 Flp pilus assembly complex ATPase component TadA [Burkholderia dolosa]
MNFPSSAPPPRMHRPPPSLSDAAPATARRSLDAAQLDDSPAVRLLTDTLHAARVRDASDIHIEPFDVGWRIRLRIDGVLHEHMRPPAHLRDALVTRIKVLARMDIAERRLPQDGRLRIAVDSGTRGDYRVSSLPTLFGEKLVLRRLETLPHDLTLTRLGFDAQQAAAMETAIRAPHGLVLVTGPTGSGKTLSLYCALQMLDRDAHNVCTVEDPAEIQLDGINQVGVAEKAGLTFATALRALLRQDPDVIMVGEIRDAETADVAIKAAQTGHLVLSTLHTNDAPAAVARLLDIGVAPYNLAAALRLVTAQRLVRRLCGACRVRSDASAQLLREAGCDPAALESGWRPYVPRGCPACHGIGYRGRIGLHQTMPVSPALAERIVARASVGELERCAAADGMRSLRDAALAHVRDGTTSVAEAIAATPDA